MTEINIEDYGFNDEDIGLIILSVNTSQRTFNFKNEEDYKKQAKDYLESSLEWLIDNPDLDIDETTHFNKSLKYITRQITINKFMMLDVNQLSTVVNTEHSTTIPLSKAEIITPAIQTLLEPYYEKKKKQDSADKSISIVGRKERDYGF